MVSNSEEVGALNDEDGVLSCGKDRSLSDMEKWHACSELFFGLSASSIAQQTLMHVNEHVLLLRLEQSKHFTILEGIYKNRSGKGRLSLETSRKLRERMQLSRQSFRDPVSSLQPSPPNFLDTVAFFAAARLKSLDEYAQMVLKSFSCINWQLASPEECFEIYRSLCIEETKLSAPLQQEFCAAKFHLALRSCRLYSVLRSVLCSTARVAVLDKFELPQVRQKVLHTQVSMQSILTQNYPLPFHLKDTALRCFLRDDCMELFINGKLIRYEVVGLMGTRLRKLQETLLDSSFGEQIIWCSGNIILSVQPIASSTRASRSQYVVRVYDITSKQVVKYGRLHFCGPASYSWSADKCVFCCCDDTLAVLSYTSSSAFFKCCLKVHTCSVGEICSGTGVTLVNTEGTALLRNPLSADGGKALYFTTKTSLSIGCVTLKDLFSPFCIEFWVYPRAATETQTILSIGNRRVDEVFIEIEAVSEGVVWRGGTRDHQLGLSFVSFTTAGKLSVEQWWHVALCFTGAKWALWLNTRFVAVQPAVVSPRSIHCAKCTLGRSFVGFLSEVRVWNCARTAIQLSRDAHRQLSGTETGLCAYFRLDEGGGDVVVDYSPGGEHALSPHDQLHWCACPPAPVARRWDTELPYLISDFVPLAQRDNSAPLHFSMSSKYFTVGVMSQGTVFCLFQYHRSTFALAAQTRIDLPEDVFVKDICCCSSQRSIYCSAVSKLVPDQLLLWNVGEYNGFCLDTPRLCKPTLWTYGREVLLQIAEYVHPYSTWQRFFLIDGATGRLSIPPFTVDEHPDTLSSLLTLAQGAIAEADEQLAHAACALLHVNMLFRRDSSAVEMEQELGPVFSDAAALLAMMEDEKVTVPSTFPLRDGIVRVAFTSFAEESALLKVCCCSFLSEMSRIQFIRTAAGHPRSTNGEKLFACLIDLYHSLRMCHEAFECSENIQVLFQALLLESAFQFDRSLRSMNYTKLQKISRCLEVVQELFLALIAENPQKAEFISLGASYTRTLLKTCEKTAEAATKTLRKHPHIEKALLECLKVSHVGSLLTSFTLSLPQLPISIFSTCQVLMQECHAALSSVMQVAVEKVMWMSELGVAITFSLCLVGCALLREDLNASVEKGGGGRYLLEPKYLNIMRSGQRKHGTMRDVLIRNLQQGVGPISKAFDELQQGDRSALRLVRDEQWKKIERSVMAAFCALMIPTKSLKDATAESLRPAFLYVMKMRPWILSKRQESKDSLTEIEDRANFLSRFESCICSGSDTTVTEALGYSSITRNSKRKVGGHRDATKWRSLFKHWKALRLLKTLTSSQEESDTACIGGDIADFLQSSTVRCDDVRNAIDLRTRNAHYRLAGLLLLKQLVDEARVNVPLSYIILPVISKQLCGWQYGEGADCCSSEDIFRLHGAFFQLFDAVLDKYLDESKAGQPSSKKGEQSPWADLFLSLLISVARPVDFRKIRGDLVGRAIRAIWGESKQEHRWRVNGVLPLSFRQTKLDTGLAAANIRIGDSGLTFRVVGGRGSCLAPCKWRAEAGRKMSYTFYYEIHVIDLLPGAVCSVGVGPFDYTLSRLPGWEPNSFALLSDEGVLFSGTNTGHVTGHSFSAGDVVGCGWNVERREVYWTKNSKFLLSTSSGEAEVLNPIVGVDGRGTIKINFGNSRFCFNGWSEIPLRLAPVEHQGSSFRWTRMDAWDAYRIFSFRAVLCLQGVHARTQSSPESVRELAVCVGHCLTTLSEEILHLCSMLSVRNFSGLQGADVFYLKALLRHCSILTQLLSADSLRYVVVSHVLPLTETLQTVVLSLFQLTSISAVTSFPALAVLGDLELFIAVLTTWYHTMNLAPPEHFKRSVTPPQLIDKAGASRSSHFLSILLSLAGRLCMDCFPSSSLKVQSSWAQAIPLNEAQLPEGVYWMALALLQHINGAGNGGDRDAGVDNIDEAQRKMPALSLHTWAVALHEWIITVFAIANQHSRDVLVALSILGGGARLAAPGDIVHLQRNKHPPSKAILIQTYPTEEICEIIEEGKRSIITFRHVDLVISDDESGYFPLPSSTLHCSQAEEVLLLALRLQEGGGASSELGCSALMAQLLSILRRSALRKIVQLPPRVVATLSRIMEAAEFVPEDLHKWRIEKLAAESCSAERPYTLTLLPEQNTSDDFFGALHLCSLASPVLSTSVPQSSSLLFSRRVRQIEDDDETDEEEEGEDVLDSDGDDDDDDNDNDCDEEESTGANISLSLVDAFPGTPSSFDAAFNSSRGHIHETIGATHQVISFEGGYISVRAARGIGLNYTLDLHLRAQDLLRPQIIFAQRLFPIAPTLVNEGTDANLAWLSPFYVAARISNLSIEYGLLDFDALCSTTAPPPENICRFSLVADDAEKWIRLTFVQSGSTLSLFRDGAQQDSKRIVSAVGPLLHHELFFGGVEKSTRTALRGYMKVIQLYDIAMHLNMIESLPQLSDSLFTFTESRLCLLILAREDGFGNYSRSPASVVVDIKGHGDVGYLEASVFGKKKEADTCTHELDFGNDADELDLFSVDTSWTWSSAQVLFSLINSKRDMPLRLVLSSYRCSLRRLIASYCTTILAELLHQTNWKQVTSTEWFFGSVGSKERCTLLKRLLQYTVSTGNDALYCLATADMQAITCYSENSSPIAVLCDQALQSLLSIAQRPQSVRAYESAHPLPASLSNSTQEISVENERYYQFFFDARSFISNMFMTFSVDKALSCVLVQSPGFALMPFALKLPRVYFDVRSTTASSQWGYKLYAVYSCLPQLRAVRLVRTVLTTALERGYLQNIPFLQSTACLLQLGECAKLNTGKTRRLALSCLSDLFLFAGRFDKSLVTPLFSVIHDIRRMAERRYRKHPSTQSRAANCRFLRASTECYVFFMDAWRCWSSLPSDSFTHSDSFLSPSQEHSLFAQRRIEQRALYRFRDTGTERVILQRIPDVLSLRLDWTTDRICVARNDGSCASMIAQTLLVSGKWYFEVRIGTVGNTFIGVLPHPVTLLTETSHIPMGLFAFNGYTGMLHGADGTLQKIAPDEVWRRKDYVGVVLDLDEKMCRFLVDGKDIDVSFSFGLEEGRAAAAAWPGSVSNFDRFLSESSFCPFFSLEKGELLYINFGGSHFEYEPPPGCLPLDPVNLMLGTLLPYNQMRAFQDISLYLLTGGRHPMPPFYHEEADTFAYSTERKGPSHVSLLQVCGEGIEVSMLEVKNIGTDFLTVVANCSVLLGCWYYEVLLHTQGLMQIGWMVKDEVGEGSVGDTFFSWSIDLFRRVRWNKGVAEPLSVSRRWSAGDVIGCALNLPDREMTFFLNGRSIGTTALATCTFWNLPLGPDVEYVPAVSLRAGNHVSFNFGSSPFKYKPDGFCALGAPDSWCERIDTFYSNERPNLVLRRTRGLRELWLSLPPFSMLNTQPPSGVDIATHLQPYQLIVAAVDRFCQQNEKTYTQVTQEILGLIAEKDIIFSDTNTTAGDALAKQKRSEELWEKFSILLGVARVAQAVLPFININTHNVNIMTKLFLALRSILFRTFRTVFAVNLLKESNVRTEHLCLSINRMKARAERRVFRSSVFGQTLGLLSDQHPMLFQTNRRFWNTTFLGEGAEDVGGPFREHLNEMCQELMSSNLSLFVPTANHTHNLGKCRDAFVPAASLTGQMELSAFVFVGNLMGGAMRSEEPLSLFFPPLVWKYLCYVPIEEADLDDVDHICWQCIQEFRDIQKQVDGKEAFDDAFGMECFATKLSDQSAKELIPGGANVKVTFERCSEYAEALLRTRLHEFDLQLTKMREGILQVVPDLALLLLTPSELELRVCGQADFEVKELRTGAVFEGLSSDDRRVLFLWTALEEATPLQRRLFLRFVSGRDRLPVKLRVLPLLTTTDPNMSLPRAATCFFTIELPDYSSLEVMKEKLYYSIENCQDMDTDFIARPIDDGVEPQLLVGMEDNVGRPGNNSNVNIAG